MTTAVAAVLAGILGAVVGSFLNVVAYRLPRGESLVAPRSRCPGCAAAIASYDNIPVVSWLLLRGRYETGGLGPCCSVKPRSFHAARTGSRKCGGPL